MYQLSDFGKDYLLLGLRIGKIIDKYVDSYFGPSELKFMVENEAKMSSGQLLEICKALRKKLKNQNFGPERVKYLEKTLIAIQTTLEIMSGIEIPYIEQVERLFDIKPQYIDDSKLFKAVEKLDSATEGTGPLYERVKNILDRQEVPRDKIIPSLIHAMELVRTHTYELFPDLLPDSEEVYINEVHDKSWTAYNWYKGNYKSQIDINVDLPLGWFGVLSYSAHEGYPGHHTECSIKDKLLYQEKGCFEQCILLIHTPKMVMYEGKADLAVEVLFTLRKQLEIALENYCPNPEKEDLNKLIISRGARKQLMGYLSNFAYHLYVDGWSDDQLIKYIKELGFLPENQILGSLRFVRDPLWAPYSLIYYTGGMLIRNKFGDRPSPEDYKFLLENPVLPSDLI